MVSNKIEGRPHRWRSVIQATGRVGGVQDEREEIARREREPNPPKVRLNDLYDLETLRPREEYLDRYRKFTRIFRDMGLEYPTWER